MAFGSLVLPACREFQEGLYCLLCLLLSPKPFPSDLSQPFSTDVCNKLKSRANRKSNGLVLFWLQHTGKALLGVSLHFLLCNVQMGSLGFPRRLILALKLYNKYHSLAFLPGTKLFTGTTTLNPQDSPNSSASVAPFYRSENGS